MQREQHMQALRLANEVRQKQAQVRRELAALPRAEGVARVVELIEDHDPRIARMQVQRVLAMVRHLGPIAIGKVLRDAELNGSKSLLSLTPRQTGVLLDVLRGLVSPSRQLPAKVPTGPFKDFLMSSYDDARHAALMTGLRYALVRDLWAGRGSATMWVERIDEALRVAGRGVSLEDLYPVEDFGRVAA